MRRPIAPSRHHPFGRDCGAPAAHAACAISAHRRAMRARLVGAAGAVAAQRVEPVAQVDVIAAEAALGEHGAISAAARAAPSRRGIDHHAREARRQRQPAERLALAGDAAGAVDRAEVGEQRPRLGQRGGRRRIEKHQLAGIGDAPLREVEHQRRTGRRRGFPAGA